MKKTNNYVPVPIKEYVFEEDPRRFKVASIEQKGYDIYTDGKRFSVEPKDFYRENCDLFDFLYYNMGVFYSIAPNYFAVDISLNRPIHKKVEEIISLYYKRVDLSIPNFSVSGIELYEPKKYDLNGNKVVVGLSGGKDSVYALVKAVEQYGNKNVKAVFIDNIMKVCPEQERQAANTICKILDVELVSIKITNSFKKHKGILNGAEIAFATALIIPVAVSFGAAKVILGTIESEVDIFQVQAPAFSETKMIIDLYNEFLKEIGLGIEIISGVPDTRTPLVYLMQQYPHIMKETVSCMMPSNYLQSHMNRSHKNYPDFPFYDRMCGVCAKCMMINVFRMRYDETLKPYLSTPSLSKYCQNVFNATVKKRYDFKADIIDEIEEIVDETLRIFEMNINL